MDKCAPPVPPAAAFSGACASLGRRGLASRACCAAVDRMMEELHPRLEQGMLDEGAAEWWPASDFSCLFSYFVLDLFLTFVLPFFLFRS